MFLEIIDLTVDLDDFKLDKINFSVNKGEYLILIGPTGSGKSVLLETIIGFPGAAVELVQCPYFTTRLLETETPMMRDYATLDSFVVYICMTGSVELRDDNGNELTISQGQTVLFPATTQSVTLEPTPQTKLLETYIT